MMYSSVDYFQDENQQDLNHVDKIIQSQVKSDVTLINQIGNYIIASGGKRLRPIMLILSGKVLGFHHENLYQQAAMMEFIHTSTLLHDDVVDGSDLRRGKKTANRVFGNAAAILVGDFLYTRAFQLMVSANNMQIMHVMSEATNIIATGEVMQLMHIGNTDITTDEYWQVIEKKTAKLFEAATQVGGILGGATTNQQTALKNYGKYMGLAFQIIDDILDYSGNNDAIGKNVGDDLAEGKPTLPLIYLLYYGSDKIKQLVQHALKYADNTHFTEIYHYISSSSALDYCYQESEKLAREAQKSLQTLPKNRYTDALFQLAVQSVARIN